MAEFKYQKDQLKTFWYWINERHSIYVKRKERKEPPWTKDPILSKYKFTNPFRQLDRVTECWTDRYVYLLGTSRPPAGSAVIHPGTGRGPSDGDILFHVALFRLFNWPATYDALFYMSRKWSYDAAMDILEKRRADKEQIFTGAYIIPNMGSDEPKINIIAGAVDLVHESRVEFAAYIRWARSMEKTCEVLQLVPTIGPFIAYEMACDLRHTRVLADVTDAKTWANPGPGAKRGIHRLLYGSAKNAGKVDYLEVMRDLLLRALADKSPLSEAVRNAGQIFEMREIEHSLCEFDKYMRVKNSEGRPRSLFKPSPVPPWEEVSQTRSEAAERFKRRMGQPKSKRIKRLIKEAHGPTESVVTELTKPEKGGSKT